jgi:AraC-like DNA-binding protein
MHAKAGHDWTIEELATQVGQSRSLFAKRFADLLGMPPMHYLAQWRMQIASERLGSGNANVATIAAEIGYESEAAFSRAFKKLMGVPPSDWRRGVRSSPPIAADRTGPAQSAPASRRSERQLLPARRIQ